MTSTTSFYGDYFDASKQFDLNRAVQMSRCCVGGNYRNAFHNWNVVNGQTYCEFCATTCFKSSEIKRLEKPTKDTKCYTVFTNVSTGVGVHNRVTNYGGLRYNVNLIKLGDSENFVPAVKSGDGLSITEASRRGVHICEMPSHTNFEIAISGDPNHEDYRSDRIFMLKRAKMGDGREIIVKNSNGSTNIRYNMKESQLIVDSRISGDPETRFAFVKCSEREESAGLAPEHNKKSNIFEFEIDIYGEYDLETQSNYGNSTGVMRGGGGVMRGPAKGVMRGAPKGGATLETYGESHHVKTSITTKQKRFLRTVTIFIQLVTSESEETLMSEASKIQEDMKAKREQEIMELESKLARAREGETTREAAMACLLND